LRAQHVEVVHAWQRPGEAEAADALLLRSIAPAGSPGAPARGDGS